MKPKEALSYIGRAAGYITGADVFIKTEKEDTKITEKLANAPLREKPLLVLRGSSNLTYGTLKQLTVIPYRVSGLDLVTRGIRKIVNKDKPTV